MFLMGRIDDTYEKGMYPLVRVIDIRKEDLVRCKRDEIIIYDLEQNKYYDYETNSWKHCNIYQRYTDQWDKASD